MTKIVKSIKEFCKMIKGLKAIKKFCKKDFNSGLLDFEESLMSFLCDDLLVEGTHWEGDEPYKNLNRKEKAAAKELLDFCNKACRYYYEKE